MASLEQGPSKRRRQNITRACNGCRRRRCKCDGVQPVCGTCAASGHECTWSTDNDARRPATKQLVESLRVKIQVLEAEVARLKGRESSGLGSSSATSLFVEGPSGADQHQPRITSGAPEDTLIPESPMISNRLMASISPRSSPPEPLSAVSAERSASVPTTPFTSTVTYKYIFQIDTSLPNDKQPTDTRLSLVCDWNRHLPSLDEVPLTRLEHDIILSRCFKYGTSWLLGLVPEIFLHDMLYSLTSGPAHSQSGPHARLQHYAPMLHCSILAFASAFSDNPTIRSRATRDKFALHAKQWLDEEFKQPVMCLVRALALLAEYHCGIGERETGYMYMGMSIRSARSMVSIRDDWVGQGIIAYPESITREWHYWSTFAQDKIMALGFGRMFDMPIPYFGINLPSVDSDLDSRPWPIDAGDTSAVNRGLPRITTLAFLESAKLMVIGARIIDSMHPHDQGPQKEEVVINLHLQLDTWFNNLPEGLLVWARSSFPLPHVIMLHICYWWLLIHLHQPYYERPPLSDTHSRQPTTDLSVKMCDRAAHKIVQLLTMFSDQHEFRFLPRNMLQAISACGSALLMESMSAPAGAAKRRATAHDGVGVCIRALREVSSTWPCAANYANELEARLEEQRPISAEPSEGVSMEIDELAEDTIDDVKPDVSRMSHPPTHEQALQSHDSVIQQMPPARQANATHVKVKIKVHRPVRAGVGAVNNETHKVRTGDAWGWDHVLMQAFPVSWAW